MRHRASALTPALDRARIALTFGNAGHIDLVAVFKHIDLDLVADLEFFRRAEFAQVLLDREASFLELSGRWLGEQGFPHIAKATCTASYPSDSTVFT